MVWHFYPLAAISAVTERELPGIYNGWRSAWAASTDVKWLRSCGGAAYVLLGLRHSAALAAQLLQGVKSMKESTTHQAILEEGRQEGKTEGAIAEAKKVLRLLGGRGIWRAGRSNSRRARRCPRFAATGRPAAAHPQRR